MPSSSRKSVTETAERRDALDAATLARFHLTGWSIVEGFFNHAQTRDLQSYAAALANLPEVSGEHMIYREPNLLEPGLKVLQRIEDCCPHHAGFDAIINHGALRQAVSELFGEEALLFKDKINFKLPGGAGFEPHQDQQAGWSRYAPLFITAMVTIDAATVANGCLEIATMPRASGLIGETWKPLAGEQLASLHLKAVPTLPGDVIFFDSYVAHASKPNMTTRPRRVLYVTYNRASDGDLRARYFADKRAAFPPDIDRLPGIEYRFRV